MKRINKREPSRERKVNEIWVSYGQTRSIGQAYEFDRIDVGFSRDLLPDENEEKVMADELDGLKIFINAYMAGEI